MRRLLTACSVLVLRCGVMKRLLRSARAAAVCESQTNLAVMC